MAVTTANITTSTKPVDLAHIKASTGAAYRKLSQRDRRIYQLLQTRTLKVQRYFRDYVILSDLTNGGQLILGPRGGIIGSA